MIVHQASGWPGRQNTQLAESQLAWPAQADLGLINMLSIDGNHVLLVTCLPTHPPDQNVFDLMRAGVIGCDKRHSR